jgi:CheY-like chemotaxis protein
MTVVAAQSGSAALTILERRADIDIVLMDIKMPDMNGYETMTAIRKRPQSADVPIIAITARSAVSVRDASPRARRTTSPSRSIPQPC